MPYSDSNHFRIIRHYKDIMVPYTLMFRPPIYRLGETGYPKRWTNCPADTLIVDTSVPYVFPIEPYIPAYSQENKHSSTKAESRYKGSYHIVKATPA